jgi:hypothetical protein
MRNLFASVLLAGLLALSQRSAQAEIVPPPPNVPRPSGNGEKDLFQQLIDEMQSHPGQKLGEMPVSKARVCGICKKLLASHIDPDFECIPLDERTGEPMKVQKIKTAPADCPSCKTRFTGAFPGQENDQGGRDKDFCAHSIGKYCVTSKVWMCPDCGYAALIEHFGYKQVQTRKATPASEGVPATAAQWEWQPAKEGALPVDEKTRAFVRDTLLEKNRKRMVLIAGVKQNENEAIPRELLEFSSYVPQTEIPDWLKYDNALKIYAQSQQVPHAAQALLFRDAAHACRREVCGEVAVPGLHNKIQESLGKSIRRINYLLNQEAGAVRRQRGEPADHPAKPELDPRTLVVAAQNLVKQAEAVNEELAKNPVKLDTTSAKYFDSGDMYVLYIRYAGALDRLGNMEYAEQALVKAKTYLPQTLRITVNRQENKAAEDFFTRQLDLLRREVDDRIECLRQEQKYLFSSADHYMAAIKNKTIALKSFSDIIRHGGDPLAADPAPIAYLLGEMLRRCNAPADSGCWFNTADSILGGYEKQLEQGAKNFDIKPGQIDDLKSQWAILRQWLKEQRALNKPAGQVEEHVKTVAAIVLKAAGAENANPNAPPPDTQPGPAEIKPEKSTPAVKPTPSTADSLIGKGTIKTRVELYKMYHAAMLKYRADKKTNPPKLADLVAEGYIKGSEANLDEKGKLHCPEKPGKTLGYSNNFEPGNKDQAILYPINDPGSSSLFADGEVFVFGARPPKDE